MRILAGDFNKSFSIVVKELRSRGVLCEMVAWYPWYANGAPCWDSCGIYVVGMPVRPTRIVELCHYIQDVDSNEKLHDPEQRPFMRWPAETGPGMLCKCFNPKNLPLFERLRTILERQFASDDELKRAAVAAMPPNVEEKDKGEVLKANEKRLRHEIWAHEGEFYNGAHFPIQVFLEGAETRRSQTGILGRKKKDQATRRENNKKSNDRNGST